MKSELLLLGALVAVNVSAEPSAKFIMPPKAVPSAEVVHEVTLAPIYAADFMCSEHYEGQLSYAGDALGTDCMITGGVDGDSGYSRPFRTDGRANQDWYGFGEPVLSPTDGTVVGVLSKSEVNTPGTISKPPAAMIEIRRADGVIVLLAHLAQIAVKQGDPVKRGERLGVVGNNGFARAPHIHVGAWRQATAEPLQIRWDLHAMGVLRGDLQSSE